MAFTAKGVESARVEADAAGGVDLGEALRLLARRGVTRVFSEGGPRVGARLVALGLADEVVAADGAEAFGEARPSRARPEGDAVLNDPARYREIEAAAYGADSLRRLERLS